MTRLSNTKTQSKWSHISNDIIRAYSIPLILGVIVALIVANAAPHWYEYWIEEHLFFGKFTFAWFVENIFMVFFFGSSSAPPASRSSMHCLPEALSTPSRKRSRL